VVVGALLTDWATVKDVFFDTDVLRAMWPDVITTALKNTVIYTACGFAFGLVLGLLLALMRLSPVGPYRWIATGIIEFFRGVPALVVFIALGFGVPLAFQREMPGGTVGVATVALGLVGGAYMAETIRAGIQAVPKGQIEAARSLGMPQGRAMISIVIPQAFRIVLPPLTNELILLTKDSSLIYVLGYTATTLELTAFGREVLNQEKNLTPLVGIGLCYLMITIPLSIVVRRMEARAEKAR
jgi:polar amino acid transport system permease protein